MVQRKVWMEKLTNRRRSRKSQADNLLLGNAFDPHCSKRFFHPCSGQPLRVTLLCLTSNQKSSIYRLTSSMPLHAVTDRCPFWTFIARWGNARSFRLYNFLLHCVQRQSTGVFVSWNRSASALFQVQVPANKHILPKH